MARVLIVGDEPQLLRAVRTNLRARRLKVDIAPDSTTALAVATRQPPDVVILDLGLANQDGLQALRGLRGWTQLPIIILAERCESADTAEAFDAGADDYVIKPFSMNELLARLRAALRPSGTLEIGAPFTIGHHLIDLATRTIIRRADGTGTWTDDEPQRSVMPQETACLTAAEWNVLDVLVRNSGKLVRAQHVLAAAGAPNDREINDVRLAITGLRRKLEIDPSRPRHLISEPGLGYRHQS